MGDNSSSENEINDTSAVVFEDNLRAAALFGPFNAHLVLLESELGVRINQIGNELRIHGEMAHQARDVLDYLYKRLKKGKEVTEVDVKAAILFARNPAPKGPKGKRKSAVTGGAEQMAMGALTTQKKVIEARNPAQKAYLTALLHHELVFGLGPAGTGKTYLAVAAAVNAFLERKVDRIMLSRPAVEAGERLGFLPGDMKDKVDPYLRPLYDALNDMLPSERLAKLLEAGTIEVAPLAFMRGRTFSNAFVVLDEAQNCTVMQMKMFLTRLGEQSRMAITGDPTQIDLPPGQKSGLAHAVRLLEPIKGVGVSRFTTADVVRHPLVGKIIDAYDQDVRQQREAVSMGTRDD